MNLFRSVKFKKISTRKCYNGKKIHTTRKLCKRKDSLFHSGRKLAIEYAAKLNIPLFPKKGRRQIVFGNSKYLLPYLLLPKYFNVFTMDQKAWSLTKNMYLFDCIANQYFKSDIIRIITTPSELVDEKNNYRITAEEICILKQYNYFFYKYNSKEFNNIYFCSKYPLKQCSLVDTEKDSFECETLHV